MSVESFLQHKELFLDFLEGRKCKINNYDKFISKVSYLYKLAKTKDIDYYYALIYLVGRSDYCITLGDIRDFFNLRTDYVLSLSRKISRRIGLKFGWNVDACIKRTIDYCGITDPNAKDAMERFISIFGSGRQDILIAFSAGFIYGCDVTDLYGISLSTLKYHLKTLLDIEINCKNKETHANSKNEQSYG